jgi:hypothetical protein
MHADDRPADPRAGTGMGVWSSAPWRAEATAWLDDRLADIGERRTGDVEQPHLRPWATALRAPTSRGPVWLKAPGPGAAFEVPLYRVLTARCADRVLTPLAVDEDRRWLLLPDGGPVLADAVEGEALVGALCAAVRDFGQLQLDLAGCLVELAAAGVPDMRAEVMPARFEEALCTVAAYVEASGDGDRAVLERLRATREDYARSCQVLAGSSVPASLQHGDLHPCNIFAPAAGRTAPVFFDWGDSTIAHPFTTMLVTLRVVRQLTRCADDGQAVHRVRDAYLEPFSGLASRHELVDELERACVVGKVARCLTWAGALSGLPPHEAAEDADMPFAWLSQLLDASYLGAVHAD